MAGPEDPRDSDLTPDRPDSPDGSAPGRRPDRLDRLAIEEKWRARWAERPQSTPVRRLPTDAPPLDLVLGPVRSREVPVDEDDEEEDELLADDTGEGSTDGGSTGEGSTGEGSAGGENEDPDSGDDSLEHNFSEGTVPFDLASESSADLHSETASESDTDRRPRDSARDSQIGRRRESGSQSPPVDRGSVDGDVDGDVDADVDAAADAAADERPFYCLDMFPYPSTGGFSVNQLRGIAVTDVVARYQRARGREVFRPLGWDSFGVGIEQEALELGVSPAEVVEEGIKTMRSQLEQFGAMVNWDAELRTSDPEYYRWTQWLFLKLHEHGLAVREEIPMKWCADCRMNLANEEVSEGSCVHCGAMVEERKIPQWKVRTTEYADRLHQGLRTLKWPPRVKALQRNWIGRRDGFVLTLKARSEFQEESEEFEAFTRRLEVLADCTFVILAPEHPVIDAICDVLYTDEVAEYRESTRRRTERERLAAQRQPEGVPTGAWALNPVTLRPMPIWVSASVLPTIRLGAILAHPESDPKLRAFAEHFRIAQNTGDPDPRNRRKRRRGGRARRGKAGLEGGALSDVRRRVRSSLDARGLLESRTDFHLRDWIFARQRYWGEPIPIIHCSDCGEVPVPEDQLPVVLPLTATAPVAKDGESPLAQIEEFIATTCPRCGGAARRETDTMPQWAASGWYYLRYLSAQDPDRIFDSSIGKRWLPVNLCVGGIEHSILHLLYVRFFSYFFHDLGLTEREEPFRRLFNQGRIRAPGAAAEDGHRGPRILAEEVLKKWGADVLRLHLLFLGPPAADTEWDEQGLRGCARFIQRAHDAIVDRAGQGKFVSRRALVLKHRLIRRVTRAIRTFHLNKAVSAFMEFVKELRDSELTFEEVDRETLKTFVVLLQPFVPHLAAELWERLGETSPLEDEAWPEYSDELLRPLEVEIAVLVDGRIADRVVVDPSLGKTELLHLIEQRPNIAARTKGRRADRVIVVPERLVHLIFSKERTPGESAGSDESESPPPEEPAQDIAIRGESGAAPR